ncbi:FecR family protein [Pedobacter africanus]|uniref:FecR family protein n=1 Tax=Pedobacter africanus TaxID=151894 RepID=A0A1W2CUG8_9SPHI|nr:FecR family protein [Pedobacter africanus]SMC88870.1 FecR family protein [Pedobacter africanus]
MKDNPRLLALYKLHRDKLASAEEQEEFEKLLSDQENEEFLKSYFDEVWGKLSEPVYASQEISNSREILDDIIRSPQKLPRKVKLWPKWAVAASIAIVIFTGGYLYFQTRSQNSKSTEIVNDIAPGKNGATLTLANGQKILINDALAGNIATQAGVSISKNASGQIIYEITDNGSNNSAYNSLSTTRGEQTQVRLPDGTLVFLNAESSLKYPTSFRKLDKRQVSLTGEGYFEVAKDKAHPFIVKTANQEVEVLGTHFNINTYSSESNVRTTLLEGSVKISSSNNSKILKPNEQAILSGDGNIRVSEADAAVAVAWKNNQFMFDSENIQTVMRMIERWYDVDVEYVGEITDEKFWGGVSRFDKVSKVLKSLESTGKVHFKIEGRKIYVSK